MLYKRTEFIVQMKVKQQTGVVLFAVEDHGSPPTDFVRARRETDPYLAARHQAFVRVYDISFRKTIVQIARAMDEKTASEC